jgi:hypothetical protein
MTHGRTRPAKDAFDLICVVASAGPAEAAAGLEPEHGHILDLCQRPLSVAEIAARLDLPVGVVRVLLDDLLERNSIVVRAPLSVTRMPSKRVLKAVINGLRAL